MKKVNPPFQAIVLAFLFSVCPVAFAQLSGSLDTTFGSGGIASVSGQLGSAGSSAMQADGKILVLSTRSDLGARLVRFNADGSLDEGFGNGGVVAVYWPSTYSGQYGWANDVAIQNIGGSERIILAGYAAVQSRNKLIEGTRVDRLLSDGSADNSFGTQGSISFAGTAATSAAIQADQKILLGNGSTIYRLNANGSTDTLFGSGGKVSSIITGEAMQVQNDGKIVVAGYITVKNKALAAVSRHNANGSVDTSFGSSGRSTADFAGGRVWDVVIGANGDIYAGGTSGTTSLTTNVVAARFTPFGQLDASFGSGGIASFDSGVGDQCQRIALQPDGKILLTGNTTNGQVGSAAVYDLLTVRFDTAGNPDYTFGTNGGYLFDLFGSPGAETARGVFVRNVGTPAIPDYRIIVAGGGSVPGNQYSFAVRLNY